MKKEINFQQKCKMFIHVMKTINSYMNKCLQLHISEDFKSKEILCVPDFCVKIMN